MGITSLISAIAGAIPEFGIGAALEGAGLGTAAGLATGEASALLGAGLGATQAGLTGKDPLSGAFTGGLTGGVLGGFGGSLGNALGGGTAGFLGETALGAGAGALGAGITGQDPGQGALGGAVSGAISGGMRGGGGGSSAASLAPAGGAGGVAAGGGPVDLTQGIASGSDFSPGAITSTPLAAPSAGPELPGFSQLQAGAGDSFDTRLLSTPGGSGPEINPVAPNSFTSADAGGNSNFDPEAALRRLGQNPVGTEQVSQSPLEQFFSPRQPPSSLVMAAQGAGVPGAAPTDALTNLTTQANAQTDLAKYSGYGSASGGPSGGAGTKMSFGNLMSDPLGTLSSNPGVALGALGLGAQALRGNQSLPGMDALSKQAATLSGQANQLSADALNKGLPAGAQAQLDQAANAMKAKVQSQFARMGLGNSTMEAQALSSVDQQISGQGYAIMQSLMQQGLSAAQAANVALSQIMSASNQQQNALTGAIGQFAGGLAGGSARSA